ncbi:MAG TPA: glutaminase A [Miltoncostaeaceae bacterium]|nr:glutaminase A [Miltoncostaeaceae bacterium]
MADSRDDDARPFVSTGHLPTAAEVRALVEEAHATFSAERGGALSSVYPALAQVAPELFGVCVVGVSGAVHAAGDADVPFPIMSVAKPFTFALVCQAIGPHEAGRRIGVNATGLPFNAPEALERADGGRTNPMVNPGAIATAGLIAGASPAARWEALRTGLSAFAGRPLELDQAILRSASSSNHRNRLLASLLHERGRIDGDPRQVLDLYTRQSCLSVTARDLAVMGATLADGGVNPLTRRRVVDADVCRHVLSVMATAGLYETSGDWLYEVGLPGKSGIGGGMVTISPGKGGLGTFSPLLDAAGNSVRGRLVAGFLSRRLGLDLFASQPQPAAAGGR